jgi:hypothetical protein
MYDIEDLFGITGKKLMYTFSLRKVKRNIRYTPFTFQPSIIYFY